MFNIFKNKKESDSPAHEELVKAKDFFQKEEYNSTLSTLTSGFEKDIYYAPLYTLASECLDKMGGEEESQLFAQASQNLTPETFKNLGNYFSHANHYRLTRIFLTEAFKTDKDVNIAHDLAIAYARRFQTQNAQETLEEVSDNFDFWTFWFYVKMKILNNDQNDLENQIADLGSAFDPKNQDESLVMPRQKVQELRESFARLKAINPQNLIRDWQFVQYGSLILDFFFDDTTYVAGGRHVSSWGSTKSMKSTMTALGQLLADKNIHQIVHTNTRDAEIIALVLGNIMNTEVIGYDNQKTYQNCLFVASNAHELGEIETITTVDSNIAFAFVQNWLEASFVCPDIIGLLAQYYEFHWNGGMKMGDDGKVENTGIDERPSTEIAQEIIDSNPSEILKIDDFYNGIKDLLKMNQDFGHRYNFMEESPVPGSYFG